MRSRSTGELGKRAGASTTSGRGGGTDAAFAALKTKAPVVERFGLQGFGAHSTDAEYVLIDSIEPRLYLAARMIMDISRGKVGDWPLARRDAPAPHRSLQRHHAHRQRERGGAAHQHHAAGGEPHAAACRDPARLLAVPARQGAAHADHRGAGALSAHRAPVRAARRGAAAGGQPAQRQRRERAAHPHRARAQLRGAAARAQELSPEAPGHRRHGGVAAFAADHVGAAAAGGRRGLCLQSRGASLAHAGDAGGQPHGVHRAQGHAAARAGAQRLALRCTTWSTCRWSGWTAAIPSAPA